MMNASEKPRPRKDWFGYGITIVSGIIITVSAAWYQLYAAERDAAAAELERARAVRRVAVGIVEEHVLNNKPLEMDRLARIIDQQRRSESISFAIPVEEVVELAEFSISNSRHLSMDKKEEMKPIFDAFYSEQRSRIFQSSDGQTASNQLVNEIATDIQEGRLTDALDALKRLDTAHRNALLEAERMTRPTVIEALVKTFQSPTKVGALVLFSTFYFWLATRFLRKYRLYVRRRRFTDD